MQNILNEIRKERKQQDIQWGEQDRTPLHWVVILMEEVGEAAKAIVENMATKDGKIIYEHLYRAEMIQVAAVAVAAVECLDKAGGKDGEVS